MSNQWFPGRPTFTEKNISDLTNKVFIVTGGNVGIGYEISKILYSKGGTVYIATRSEKRGQEAINKIKSEVATSRGALHILHLDLGDFVSITVATKGFMSREKRLDVLFNNAGISYPAIGSKTSQGYEATMGTNCLGPYLFTSQLVPILRSTAKSASPGSVRIVFAGSGAIELSDCPSGGMDFAILQKMPFPGSELQQRNYSISKAGNWFLADGFDRLLRADGVVSVAQNPGNLRTKIWDNVPWFIRIPAKALLYDNVYGAYTGLWCGVSEEVKVDDGGRYAVPWGKWHANPRKDISESLKTEKEGGTGVSLKFWNWCEEQCKAYL